MAEVFDNLHRALQKRIDSAFDAAATPVSSFDPSDTLQAENTIPEDTGGGFLIDKPSKTEIAPNYIPLSLIPDALLRLELPPDDDQILSVFRNAASGWSSATNSVDDRHIPSGQITRDDWRSICAILLEHRAEDRPDVGSEGSDREIVDFDRSDSDHVSGDAEDTDDDDYEGVERTTRIRGPRSHRLDAGNLVSNPSELTKKQQEICFDAFSLFFPPIPLGNPPNKKIMIKDLQRVVGILGEKLTADEMVEMLAVFSSSPDKSVSLTDFGRIMAAAKLI